MKTLNLALLSAVLGACGRDGGPVIVAPSLDVTHLAYATYPYSPVGDFAAKRGPKFPFIDANGNGRHDADEVVGRCDRRNDQGRCTIDRTRLSLVTTTSDCPGTSGVWIIGKAFDGSGQRIDTTLCDEHGACSEVHENPFGDRVDIDSLFIADGEDAKGGRTLTLSAAGQTLRRDQVELPVPLELIDGHVDGETGGLKGHVRAGQSIDLANVILREGTEERWNSAGHPQTFQARGNELDVVVPQAALDECGEGCEATLSFAHVWRDDTIYAVSEVREKIL